MKKSKTIKLLSVCLSVLLISTTTFTESVEVYAKAYVSQGYKLKHDNPHKKNNTKFIGGVKPLTKEDKQWMKENMINTKSAALNEIGLKRVNEVRSKKGLKPIESSKAVTVGNEVTSSNFAQAPANKAFVKNDAEAVSSDNLNLPKAVDNSELPYFPAIGDQKGVGSCASFSTTYYQATYMNALARGWDVKNNPDDSKIFSAKWTYDFINSGIDKGSSQTNAYRLFKEQGIATQKEFPYIGRCGDYLEWSTNPDVWKNAAANRLDKSGYINICSDSDTAPIKDVDSDNLEATKQLLNDGYVLACTIQILDTSIGTIQNNTDSIDDDKYVGEKAIYQSFDNNKIPNDTHGMVIVGYNDDVWVDMNGNGKMDSGEKGAFRIANSWGTDSGQDSKGFIWVSYDALNKVSSLGVPPSGSKNANLRRVPTMADNQVYWMTMKASNTPKLLVQVDMNSAYRNQLKFQLGYSEADDTDGINGKITWDPEIINMGAGAYSFNGTATASDGTVVLDYSNFLNADLNDSTKRWYIKITDGSTDNPNNLRSSAQIKGFKFINQSVSNQDQDSSPHNYQIDGNTVSLDNNYKLSSYKEIDNNSIILSADCKVDDKDDKSQWNTKYPLKSSLVNFHNMVAYNNKIYTLCTDKADETGSPNKLLQYDQSSGLWSIIDSNSFSNLDYYIFVLNGKIYATEKNGPAHIYDISTKSWSLDSTFSFPKGIDPHSYGLTVLDDKLYAIGGITENGASATNTLWQYDPSTKNWTPRANMNFSMMYPIVSTAKDGTDGKEKIYALGGIDSSGSEIKQIQKYDPSTNTWTNDGSTNSKYSLSCYYSNSYDNGFYGSLVGLGDKIYMLDLGSLASANVYEYSTTTKTWSEEDPMPLHENKLTSAQVANGKIYTLLNDNSIYQFNPTVSKAVHSTGFERVGMPRFSIPSGTYGNQKVSLSSSTPGATIMYTTDGTDPTGASALVYKDPINIDKKMTIKAVAIKDGYVNSYVVAANYDYKPAVNSPSFSIPSGAYKYRQKVSISCDMPNAEIRYTTDVTDPTASSKVYTGPITLYDKMTIKAIAIRDGYINSPIVVASYTAPSLIGDVNGDGKLNAFDLVDINNYANGKITDFPKIDDDMWAGDLNGDGKIDEADVDLYKSYLKGTIKYFPKEQPTAPGYLQVLK